MEDDKRRKQEEKLKNKLLEIQLLNQTQKKQEKWITKTENKNSENQRNIQ